MKLLFQSYLIMGSFVCLWFAVAAYNGWKMPQGNVGGGGFGGSGYGTGGGWSSGGWSSGRSSGGTWGGGK